MSILQRLLNSPIKRAFWFLLLTVVSYFYLGRPIEFAYDVQVYDHYAYLATGQDGLRVVDIQDPEKPKEVYYYDSQGVAKALALHNQFLYLADGNNGLLVFDLSEPEKPRLISKIATQGSVQDLVISGKYAYLANGRGGLRLVELKGAEETSSPNLVNDLAQQYQLPIRGQSTHIAVQGGYALVSDSGNNLHIIDVGNPNNLSQTAAFNIKSKINEIYLQDHYAYLAAGKRGLVVIDFSDKSKPEEISTYGTPGEALGFNIQSIYGYIAEGDRGLRVVDLTDRYSIRAVGTLQTSGTASRVRLNGDYAYIADGFHGLSIVRKQILVSPEQIGNSNAQIKFEAVKKVGDNLFMAAGERGLRVLNVSNPQNPVEIGFYDTQGYAVALNVLGDLAYVADQSEGLVVLDISNPADGIEPVSVFPGGKAANDVYVHEATAFLADGASGLRIINYNDPFNPSEISHLDTPGTANGVVVLGDYAYVADGIGGLRLINISDLTIPTELGSIDTPGDARAVTEQAIGPRGSSNMYQPDLAAPTTRIFAYVADGSRGLRIIDVTQPRQPREVAAVETNGFVNFVLVQGPTAYLADRNGGVVIVNITEPTRPVVIGGVQTPGEARGLAVDGTTAYIADFERGLRIVNIARANQPVEIGAYDAPATVKAVATSGDYAYVVDGKQGMWALNVSDPTNPKEAGFLPVPGVAVGIAVQHNDAFIASGAGGLLIADVTTPTNIITTSQLILPGKAVSVALAGNFAYVPVSEAGLRIVDVSNVNQPVVVGAYDTSGIAMKVAIDRDYAWIADGPGGLAAIKVTEKQAPTRVSVFDALTDVRAVAIKDQFAYVAAGVQGFHVIDISKPLLPKEVASLPLPGTFDDIYIQSIYAFLADESGGMQIIDIANPYAPVPVGSALDTASTLSILAVPRAPAQNRPGSFLVYTANDSQGLTIYAADKNAFLERTGFYETPGSAPLPQIGRTILAYLTGNRQEVSPKAVLSIEQVAFDWLVLGLGGFIFWLMFIAQFVLPVRGFSARRLAVGRTFLYLSGGHGPAVHVRNGVLFKHKGEEKRSGLGVILIDLASAVVLGRSVVGPGLIFSDYIYSPGRRRAAQKVGWVVDLRPQVRSIANVKSSTRDGIELVCNISTGFTLGQPAEVLYVGYDGAEQPENLKVITLVEEFVAGENGTGPYLIQHIDRFVDELDEEDRQEIHLAVENLRLQTPASPPASPATAATTPQPPSRPYIYEPDRIFAALYAKAQDVQNEEYIQWTDLPAHVAAEVFRNLIARETYDGLYLPANADQYPIQQLKGNFSRAIRNLGVLSYQFVERKDHKPLLKGQVWSQEQLRIHPVRPLQTPKVLRVRGIKVLFAGFSELKPVNPQVRQGRLDTWRAKWEQESELTRADHELQAMRVRNRARIQAQQEMVFTLTRIFNASPVTQEALALRLFQALESAAADPVTRKLLPSETLDMLKTLKNWLLPEGPLNPDQPPPGTGIAPYDDPLNPP